MATLSVRGNTNWSSNLYLDLTITVTETKTNEDDNTSTLSYSYKAVQNGTSMYFTGTERANGGTTAFYVNGTKVGGGVVPIKKQSSAGSLTLQSGSGTLVVPHNEDGTKTISLQASVTKGSGNSSGDTYVWASKSGSQNMVLTNLDVLAKIILKVNETWKKGKAFLKLSGSWKKAKKIYYKNNGSWVKSVN